MLGIAKTAWRYGAPGQAIVSSVINYSFAAYSQSDLSYVGPDSSNRPVFLFAYANASNFLRAVLFRINSNGSITEGSEQNPGVNYSVYRTVQSTSQRTGAGSFNNGSPNNYAYLCYVNSTITSASIVGLLVNQDALTITFGTPVPLVAVPDADQSAIAYVGNNRIVAGTRASSGFSIQRYSTALTVPTLEGTASADLGYRIDAAELGFLNNGTTQYRSSFFDTGNSASGTIYGASELGATNYSAFNSSITGTSENYGCNLNNTDKMLGAYWASPTLSVIAVPITWNASSAPTFAPGSAQTMTDIFATYGAWSPVSGFAADQAYIAYNSSGSTVDIRAVTVSGSAVTLGAKMTIVTGLTNINRQMSTSSAVVGANKYLAGVQIRTSGAPYIWALKTT